MRYIIIFLLCVYALTVPAFALDLRSPAFGTKGEISYLYTCQDSQDLSIPLTWFDVPIATRSFAIIMEERTKTQTRVHWVIYNIPASTRQLNPGIARMQKLPNDILQGVNDFEVTGYSGPCPGDGLVHRYAITIYALDSLLVVNTAQVKKENVMAAMRGHIIEQYELTAQYTRVSP